MFFATVGAANAEPISQLAAFTSLHKVTSKLSPKVLSLALQSVTCACTKTRCAPSVLGVIDYSLPSTATRFWLFDLKHPRLLLEELVAHGKGSGENLASVFSNEVQSFQSSLGLYQIGKAYQGLHGPSLRLIGLESGYNDQAYDRNIVIHGAEYVSPQFIAAHQRLGRSHGCPTLSFGAVSKAVEFLREGVNFLFVYYPDKTWLQSSTFLNSCAVGSSATEDAEDHGG